MLITDEELERYSNLNGDEQVEEALKISKNLQGKYGEVIDGYKQIFEKTKPENIGKIREEFVWDIIYLSKKWEEIKIDIYVKNGDNYYNVNGVESKIKSTLKQIFTMENIEEREKILTEYGKKFEKEEDYVGMLQIFSLKDQQNIEEFKKIYEIISNESKLEKFFDNWPKIENDEDRKKANENAMYRLITFEAENAKEEIFDSKETFEMLALDKNCDKEELIKKLSENQQVKYVKEIINIINESKDNIYKFVEELKCTGEKFRETEEFQAYIVPIVQKFFKEDNVSIYSLKDIWKALPQGVQKKMENQFFEYFFKEQYNAKYLWENTKENVQKSMLTKLINKAEKDYIAQDDIRTYKDILVQIWSGLSTNLQNNNEELFDKIFEAVKDESWKCSEFWEKTKQQEKFFEKIYTKMLLEADVEQYDREIEIYSIWKSTNEELQKKYLNKIFRDFPKDKAELFNYTNKNLQREYFEKEEKFGDKKTVQLYMNLNKELKEERKDLFWEYFEQYVDSDFDFALRLWNRMDTKNFKADNFEKVYDIIKNKENGIIKFWRATRIDSTEISNENIKFILNENKENKEIFIELVNIGWNIEKIAEIAMSIYDKEFDMQIEIWKSLDEYKQQKNSEWFKKALEMHNKNTKDVVKLWCASKKAIQEENAQMLSLLMQKEEITEDECTEILNYTDEEILTETKVGELIEKIDKENSKQMTEVYKRLKELNPNINKTLNLKMLKKGVTETIENEKLLKLTTDINLQNNIAQNLDNKNFMKILKYVSDNVKNWTLEINLICNNINQYQELFEDISDKELNEKQLKQLYMCLLQEKNWFKISKIEDLQKYSENRKIICTQILEGKKVDNQLSEDFKNLTDDEKKIFAILELSYGIDIATAQNLVYKYGEDIEEIARGKYKNEEAVKEIKVLKSLLELKGNDAEKLYKSNKIKIQKWEEIEYSAGTHIEEAALELYEKLYRDALKFDEEKRDDLDFNGKKVSVSEIVGDFKAFIRVEGAYSYWTEPDDFSTYFDEIDPNGNGNCKSFVANNLFARARPKGPTFGYNTVIDNSLLIMAPWDIVSNEANYSFSTSSVKWNFNKGIQFRIPEKMIDMTRDNHNEVVSQKWFWNEKHQKLERDKPNFVLYVKTKSDINVEEDPQFKMSVKAAAQLKIPLKIIDMERNIEREQTKIENYIYALTQKNKTGMNDEEIIKKIVVDFENNRTAMRFADEELKQKYFTDEMREKVYDTIIELINNYENTNPEKAKTLKTSFEKAMTEEAKKSYTNAEKITDSYYEKNFFIQEKAKILNTTNIKKFDINVYMLNSIKKELENVSKLKYYENNKAHSIEHIEKVVLFSSLLAEMEGLDVEDEKILLAAAAFHDSGRSGKDGNNEHAKASAIQTLKYFEENPNNPFGITKDNISIIQTAIHYHEYREKEKGKTDTEEIKRLAKQYNVREEDILKTKRICELLKDADALDRLRFDNKATLNPEYLRSKSAKIAGVINFARNVNEKMAEKALIKIYKKNEEEISNQSKVRQLKIARIEKIGKNPNYIEPHLPISDLFDVINLNVEEIENNIKDNKKTQVLMNWYKEYGITKEDIENITSLFLQRMKANEQYNEKQSEMEEK